MDYAVPVWDPHLRKDQHLLENTQKFACKMMTKTWDRGCDELLNMTNLPPLPTEGYTLNCVPCTN